MALRVSGVLPGVMRENSRPGDWSALLEVSSTLGAVAAVEAVGPGALALALTWDAARGTLLLRPGAPVDYEAFALLGAAPEIVFSLRARLASGVVEDDPTLRRIAVQDVDDTPPTGLRFATGGAVAAGAIGAVIGTLAVTDPDSPPGTVFRFAFAEEDAWAFEVVEGRTLKLRDGISLGLDDMPLRPLLVEVSDGLNAAAFTLDLVVLDPGAPPPARPVLEAGEMRGKLGLATPGRAIVADGAAAALESLGAPDPGGARPIQLRTAPGEAWLPGDAQRIDFLDGRVELDPAGAAARAAALHTALRGEAADGAALARHIGLLEAGRSLVELAAAIAPAGAAPAAGAAEDLAGLFQAALGRAPTEAELALHLGRLGSGVARAQVALDIAAEALGGASGTAGLSPAAEPAPFWVAMPLGPAQVMPAQLLPPWAPILPVPAGPDAGLLFA